MHTILGYISVAGVLSVLAFAYREFWAKVRSGALLKAAAVLVTGWAIGIALSWGLIEGDLCEHHECPC